MEIITDMSNDNFDQRLDRIESKIDKLSDAIIAIARAEERIVAIEADKSDFWQRLNKHSAKIDEHEMGITKILASVELLEKMNIRDRDETATRLRDQGIRLGDSEKIVADMSRTIKVIHRLAWTFAAVISAYGIEQFLNIFPPH